MKGAILLLSTALSIGASRGRHATARAGALESDVRVAGGMGSRTGRREGLGGSNGGYLSCPDGAHKAVRKVDIVIPTFERDLCSTMVQAKSLGQFVDRGAFGKVIYVWASITTPFEEFRDDYNDIQTHLNGLPSEFYSIHEFFAKVAEHDASTGASSIAPRILAEINNHTETEPYEGLNGWQLQQIVKLEASKLVFSEYYLVLDAKNWLMEPLALADILDECNRSLYAPYNGALPRDHRFWFEASKKALGVQVNEDGVQGGVPLSITPITIHTQTAVEMINLLHTRGSSVTEAIDHGATEFMLYMSFLLSDESRRARVSAVSPRAVRSTTLWKNSLESLLKSGEALDKMEAHFRGEEEPQVSGSRSRFCAWGNCKFVSLQSGVTKMIQDLGGEAETLGHELMSFVHRRLNISTVRDVCVEHHNSIAHLPKSLESPIQSYFNTERAPQSVLILQLENRVRGHVPYANRVNRVYAERHELMRFKNSSEFMDDAFERYPPYWAKVQVMVEESLRAKEDFIVMLDSDAVVSDHAYRFDQLRLFDDPNVLLAAAADPYWNAYPLRMTLNAGVVVARNNDEGKALLREWLGLYEKNQHGAKVWKRDVARNVWSCDGCSWGGPMYEQGSLNQLFHADGQKRIAGAEMLLLGNPHLESAYFVNHYMGSPWDKRVETLQGILTKYGAPLDDSEAKAWVKARKTELEAKTLAAADAQPA
mmetsp:Transcript_20173/g.40734  ORF Transcript_20173/g.40734 Transcript_20173/m.40734 type:complete len:709 (+) Transcript_20173:80-2206(+)